MKALKLISLLSILFAFTIGCEKEDDVEMIYIETKCSDPWLTGGNSSDSEVLNAVSNYLDNLDIDYDDLEIEFEETYAQDCEACVCTTGRVIELEAEEEQVDELKAIGFVLE